MGVFIIIDTLVLCLLNHSKNAELLNHTDNKSVNKYEKIISNISLISRQECRHTKLGETYTGTVQYTAIDTALRYPCKYWVNVNHTIFKEGDFPDRSMQAAQNFCRNPSRNSKETLCYLYINGNLYADYCNVPLCGKSVSSNNTCRKTYQGNDYTGNTSPLV